jgi:prepilin-type N-terminal cleavage/methylation domain-containing protein
MREKPKKGFSLIESLISLSLFLVIVLACLELFGFTRNIFLKLKIQEESKSAVFSALDKMKTDILSGGSGLLEPVQLGLLESITEDEGALIILSMEKNFASLNDLVTGQTKILLPSISKLKKKREICIFDALKGEIKSIVSAANKSIVLSTPLDFSYSKDDTHIYLIKQVALFFDKNKKIIRRKINSSPAQPLLEDVALFDFSYSKTTNLVSLRISLKLNEEKEYEISIYPKNAALGAKR